MRDTCAADDSWHGYRQKFRVLFREAYTCASQHSADIFFLLLKLLL